MTAAEALADGVRRLKAAGLGEGAARDARLLLSHAMDLPPDRLTLHLPDEVSAEVLARFHAHLEARATRQPVAQIIGQREFFGRTFRVTSDTLDPRPETETLILAALEKPWSRVLDLGTGTGCILLTLLAERAGAIGTGTDLSEAALEVARGNAGALELSRRARFQRADWLAGVGGSFDLVVSNPPYITEDAYRTLAPDVLNWEPTMALTPGGDGLSAYRAILQDLHRVLAPDGWCMVEIGFDQGPAVADLMADRGLENVRVLSDLDGRDRVVIGQKIRQNTAKT